MSLGRVGTQTASAATDQKTNSPASFDQKENYVADSLYDYEELQAHLTEATKRVSDAKLGNKQPVLILGPTRSGKSTLMAFLLNHSIIRIEKRDAIQKTKYNYFLPKGYAELFAAHQVPEIGITAKGCTIYPEVFANGDMVLCDTGGFADNRPGAEGVAIAIATQYAVKSAQKIRGIIFVIDINSINAQGGVLLRDLATTMKNIFIFEKYRDVSDLANSMIFVFTKIENSREDYETILTKIKDVKDVRYDQIKNKKNEFNRASKEAQPKIQKELQDLYDEYPIYEILLAEEGRNFVVLKNSDHGIDEKYRDEILAHVAKFKAFDTSRIRFDRHDERHRAFTRFAVDKAVKGLQLISQITDDQSSLQTAAIQLGEYEKEKLKKTEELKAEEEKLRSGQMSKEELEAEIDALFKQLNQQPDTRKNHDNVRRKAVLEQEIKDLKEDRARYDSTDRKLLWSESYFEDNYISAPEKRFEYKGPEYDGLEDITKEVFNRGASSSAWTVAGLTVWGTNTWQEFIHPEQGSYIAFYKPPRGKNTDVKISISRIKRNLPEHKARIKQINESLIQKNAEMTGLDKDVAEQIRQAEEMKKLYENLRRTQQDAKDQARAVELLRAAHKNKSEDFKTLLDKITESNQTVRNASERMVKNRNTLAEIEKTGLYQILITLKTHVITEDADIITDFLKKYDQYTKYAASYQLPKIPMVDSKQDVPDPSAAQPKKSQTAPSVAVAESGKPSNAGHFSAANRGNAQVPESVPAVGSAATASPGR